MYTTSEFLSFLDRGVSPAHAVANAAALLSSCGFSALGYGEPWTLTPGGKYYVPVFDNSLVAFALSQHVCASDGIRIAASHTDWPCLHIKPEPELLSGGCLRLNIEPYGGAIYASWLDRPLSLAGTVALRGRDPLHPEVRLVSWDRPVLTIPNLAVHMNREVNNGVALKANVDLLPICRTAERTWSKDGYLLSKLAERLCVLPEEILSFDLCAFNAEKSERIGFEEDLLSAPRLDNLTSVYGCIRALADSPCSRGINVAVLYDNEEIGSNTKQGADSAMLGSILEKLCLSLGLDRAAFLDACANGMLLSCDVAHAAHPNHMEKLDPVCQSVMNGGVTLKMNFNQRYPTDAVSVAIVEQLCRDYSIPVQRFMNRADLRGGGTIGAMASALLGMRAVDVGVPILAMHSARELMGIRDEESLTRLIAAFYSA